MLYGLPTSAITDMGNHRSIRLQRAVIQRWLVDVPWAQAGQVTVGNGGDIAREAGLLPHSAVQPEYPPTPVVPLPTPTVAPPQPACAYLPVRGFGRLWSSNAQVQAALGCPTYPTQDMPVVFLAQRFQGGVMLWTEAEPGFVYALFRDQMKYIAVPDTWREGEAEPPEAAPQGFYTPTGRLGKAWREGTGVRQRLGWALEAQKVGGGWVPDPAAARNGAWQSFMYGTMVWIPYKAGSAEYMSDRWMYIVTKNYPFPPGGSRNDWMEFLEQ
jgi:hypothetical protein